MVQHGGPGPEQPADLLRQIAPPGTPLGDLLAERERLEQQLATVTGGTPGGGDPRFPVTPLAERRAEIEQWARARDRRRPAPEQPPSRPAPQPAMRQAILPLRSGLADEGLSRALPDLAPRSQLLAGARTGIGRWEHWEERFTGAMNRSGDYADARDRLLNIDSGGSGDLFARAEAALERLRERRAEQDREERRAAQAHERAHERRLEQRRETEHLERRKE